MAVASTSPGLERPRGLSFGDGLAEGLCAAVASVSPHEDVRAYLQDSLLPALGPAIEQLLHHVHEAGELERALRQRAEAERLGQPESSSATVDGLGETEEQGEEEEDLAFDPLAWLSERLKQSALGPLAAQQRLQIEQRIRQDLESRRAASALAAATALATAAAAKRVENASRLAAAEEFYTSSIAPRCAELPGIRAPELMRRLQESRDAVVLVDCRTEEERRVSTIAGALAAEDFTKAHGRAGVLVVPFDAAGGRGTAFAKKLVEEKSKAEVRSWGLGLLDWCHQGGPLVDPAGGATTRVFVLDQMLADMFPTDCEVLTEPPR